MSRGESAPNSPRGGVRDRAEEMASGPARARADRSEESFFTFDLAR